MQIGRFRLDVRRLGIVVGIVILLFLIMDFNNRMEELTRLQKEAAIVRAQATAVIVTQQALQTQVAYATSPAAVDAWAREQNRMAQDGDIVIIPLPDPNATPPPTPMPTPVLSGLTKWDVWFDLLFGE
jgi:cell division protein FtsB